MVIVLFFCIFSGLVLGFVNHAIKRTIVVRNLTVRTELQIHLKQLGQSTKYQFALAKERHADLAMITFYHSVSKKEIHAEFGGDCSRPGFVCWSVPIPEREFKLGIRYANNRQLAAFPSQAELRDAFKLKFTDLQHVPSVYPSKMQKTIVE